MRLGTYPATSLADARAACRTARSLLDQGIDPQDERDERARKETEAQAVEDAYGSLEELKDHYLSMLEAMGRSPREVRRALERDALPMLGPERQAREVSPADIARVLHAVHERGARSMANHLRRYLHRMFALGIHHDNDPRNMGSSVRYGIPFNPVTNVPHDTAAEKVGTRELSWDELRSAWFALDHHCSQAMTSALRIIACTGLRVMEVIRAEQSEFDLAAGLWRIPGHRIKTRTKRLADHLVPITPMMEIEIRRARMICGPKSQYLYPAHNRSQATKPMHDTSLAHACAEMCKATGMSHFTPRDLRRTWKTRGGELGIPMEHRNLVQNHARTDVASVHYDVWGYVEEKREALERFCDHLQQVLDADDGKVVAINRKRG